MTNPFQSIITPESQQAPHVERDQRASEEALQRKIDRLMNRAPVAAQPSVHVNGHCANAVGDDLLIKVPEPAATSRGGVYTEEDALTLLNSRYFVGTSKQETAVFRLNPDGSATFVPEKQFKLELANMFVKKVVKSSNGDSTRKIPAEKFWKEHPDRRELEIVFKPGGTTKPNQYNLWRDFGVVPRRTRRKIRSLLRHIWKVICRSDKAKFKYLIRWLAWAVQHPDKHPGTIIVLKSRKQGTGKSTLGKVMLDIFGQHGALIDDSDRLLGRFNDWVEPVCFILAEEILWAGNHKIMDKLKSRITADTFQIERKQGAILQIPNRLHIIMTTNHDHAVGAGVGDRRFVVYDVSDKYACKKSWFGPIYQDLDNGGAGEFLDFLLNIQLGDWHPREILKTDETLEQQRMSGDSISQWSQACVDADAIVGNEFTGHALGQRIASDDLRKAYSGYCRQQGIRGAANPVAFGKACAEMFGPRQRVRASRTAMAQTAVDVGDPSELDASLTQALAAISQAAEPQTATVAGEKSPPWGYDVPDGDTWQRKIDDRLGIKS